MMSAKFSDFLTPPPPCPHFHATSLTELPYHVRFSRTPIPPLECGRHKWKLPCGAMAKPAAALGPLFTFSLSGVANVSASLVDSDADGRFKTTMLIGYYEYLGTNLKDIIGNKAILG